ncbi:hypothetical protein BUALT_Bualt02G0154000 [Buddleja alternifolia]|uniref:NB-ARC domain-containing protein n=1 Tax=Buddleja alternifolia TaxID=168488 RepID=A0AAV6Y1Z2_9LAMI|nr:hypothetical protein BUALT_Bualt02G0154000 [Buddleja alternifolia]
MCPKRRRKVYRGLKRAEEEVDSILDELQRIKESCKIEVFGGSKSSLDYVDVGGSERARSAGNTMVGFDEHLTTIKDQLYEGSPELQTFPIVGMGGIEVAVYDNTVGSCHQMQFLNEEQNWNLLREKVFGQARYPLEFEDLGKSIAHNCRGLPLAIVAVAGVLSKDQEISVSRLIKLWIAEGFLKSSKEFKSLEEVGEEYLDDLVKRNLALITKKRYNGKSKFCNIHDLLKDLCTQRIRSESFFHVTSEYECISEGNKYMCRVCFNSKRGYGFHHTDKTVSSLNVCSILCLRDYFPLCETLSCAKRLRVLDALQYKISDFPDAILDLFHLRYLALHINTFYVQNTRFPPLISKLRNLETLILIPSSEHISLPSQIWKMPLLRHLIVGKATLSLLPFYTRMLCEVHILENLQTLSGVLDFRFTGKALEMIPNLNKLKVNYIGLFENGNWEFYCLNNLVNVHQLEISEYWRADDTHFPCLEHLKIRRCMKLKAIPSEIGEIPTLELIEVHGSAKAARSAELIQEEQESAGNNTLQVRVFRDYQSR